MRPTISEDKENLPVDKLQIVTPKRTKRSLLKDCNNEPAAKFGRMINPGKPSGTTKRRKIDPNQKTLDLFFKRL